MKKRVNPKRWARIRVRELVRAEHANKYKNNINCSVLNADIRERELIARS